MRLWDGKWRDPVFRKQENSCRGGIWVDKLGENREGGLRAAVVFPLRMGQLEVNRTAGASKLEMLTLHYSPCILCWGLLTRKPFV